jgi:hypothetical protein
MSPLVLTFSWVMISLGTLLGLRFARSGLQSNEATDWLMAAFFLVGVSIGFGPLLVVSTFPAAPMGLQTSLRTISFVAIQAPSASIVVFTWLVFRPGEGWARWLAMAMVCCIVLHVLGVLAASMLGFGPLRLEASTPFFWLGTAAKSLCFLWACAESLRYFVLSRRRLALGLADPLVTNRFLLWALWSGSAAAVLALRVFSRISHYGPHPDPGLAQLLVIGQILAGLVCFTAVWLTFAPPAPYRRLVGGRVQTA